MMIGKPGTRTLVTNIARGGEYVVVQTIEIEYGGFGTRAEAEAFEETIAPSGDES